MKTDSDKTYQWLRTSEAAEAVATATGCLCGQKHEPFFHVTEGASK